MLTHVDTHVSTHEASTHEDIYVSPCVATHVRISSVVHTVTRVLYGKTIQWALKGDCVEQVGCQVHVAHTDTFRV